MGEAAKKDDEELLVPVGPGARELEKEEPAEDEREDARLAQSDEGDEAEEKAGDAKRGRETARERRERAKKARDRDRLELNFFAKRNEELEKRLYAIEHRTAQNETASIDQRMTTVNAQLTNADRVLAEALRKPNGSGSEEFVEALRIRDQLRDSLNDLGATKQSRQQHTEQKREPEAAKPDPRVLRNAREWASQHDWFDFQGNDEHSVIVRAIDEALSADGYDPSSNDYWEELTSRVKRRLPEKFSKGAHARADEDEEVDEDEKPRARTGPKFSSSGRERPLRKGEVYVSAERKEAMKQYGVWDDPVARNRMLKRYQQWDADAASNR